MQKLQQRELERELGITGAIKVASNENPLGPSPKALAALPATLSQLHLYPDAGGFALRRALSGRLGVPLEQIALGNGAAELLQARKSGGSSDQALARALGDMNRKLDGLFDSLASR